MSWWTTDETHDPARTSWVDSANGHPDFPVQNLPFGVFAPLDQEPRIGVAIGDMILDLRECAKAGLVPAAAADACRDMTLNRLLAMAADDRRAVRHWLSQSLSQDGGRRQLTPCLHPVADCTLRLPAQIGDYSDFYVGIHHASNIGRQFRPDNPLLPNYKYVPIGYHGRSSSIRPSGVPLLRPSGQRKPPEANAPVFGPSERLDYELEMGIWIGAGNDLSHPIPITQAADHIGGYCLLNDWSARDLQAWEYQPLGPFLSKSFHSTISAWVISPEAMAPFRVAQPVRPDNDPAPLPYLWDPDDQAHGALSVALEVLLSSATMREQGMAPVPLSRGQATNMYWTVNQIVAHQASNGCAMRPGDLLGTGTISAPGREGYGSLIELTEGGKAPITLPTGERRTFLHNGDEVLLRATAHAPGAVSIGFGACRAIVEPAR